jgi:hypothetical protein
MTKKIRHKTFEGWLEDGMAQGWCGPDVCSTHDGTPTTEAEDEEFDAGQDPCLPIIRLYADPETKQAVEKNHSPSVWRKPQ